jgi:uncharacterized membrane protein
MLEVVFKPANLLINKLKRKFYGKTFYCPVCHLELSFHDADKDGLLVCPLCGIVIEITDVFGHPLAVVHDVEIKRHQPKMRIHPISTHIPIGLFPFALLGTLFVFVVSLLQFFYSKDGFTLDESLLIFIPSIKKMSDFFLLLSVLFSLITFISGYYDWYKRYEKRKYRMITVKIYFSILFVVLGIFGFILQVSGVVFDGNGFAIMNTANVIIACFYFLIMLINMCVIATLGHIGGLLVFGK